MDHECRCSRLDSVPRIVQGSRPAPWYRLYRRHDVACVQRAVSASNGSHTRLSGLSQQMWRWLLLATATYAAEQPRIRTFPVVTPIDPYPPAQLVLPPSAESARAAWSAVPAEVRSVLPRPLAPEVHPNDACVDATEFALLWSPLPRDCPVLKQLLLCRSFGLAQAASSNPPQVSRYCFDVFRSNLEPQRLVAWRFDPLQWKQDGGTLLEAIPSPFERALFASHCNPWLPGMYQCLCQDPEG